MGRGVVSIPSFPQAVGRRCEATGGRVFAPAQAPEQDKGGIQGREEEKRECEQPEGSTTLLGWETESGNTTSPISGREPRAGLGYIDLPLSTPSSSLS